MRKFVKGMDLSTLLELERCGARYYDKGQERDILAIMKDYDVDTIRLRLWNDPKSESGEWYGAGNNDLSETIAIGKKVTEAGFGVLLNFHYSDFWADPGKQIKPKAWKLKPPSKITAWRLLAMEVRSYVETGPVACKPRWRMPISQCH